MEAQEDEDDLKLAKASAGLLSDLERDLVKVLRRPTKSGQKRGNVHTHIKKRDLDRLTNLIEPFQGEPQLLDAKLKTILPPIIEAYLEHLNQQSAKRRSENIDLQTATCVLLYTLCKVRGYKIVVGFLNNEPRYLEPVLEALERTVAEDGDEKVQWQVPYVLLLWLYHLLLTPFDLSSISTKPGPTAPITLAETIPQSLPPLAFRVLHIGMRYLSSPTRAQDAAAAMLVRLSTRPDVQKLRLADRLVQARLPKLEQNANDMQDIYEMLGSLRLVSGIASTADLSHLVPSIYRTCEKAFDENGSSALSSNAVAKKIIVKIFRNVAVLSLRSATTEGPLLSFMQSTGVLENVVDYLLRSLGDKDTPVRFAAAKAISIIVPELDPEMGHEVVQAILDSFKEDMPRSAKSLDFATANPLKWHGLTLALAHTLFKRSASPKQLPDILDALISALQFQQRTATGSSLGTNVRDAANFGIWSLSRRYTTAELLPVKANILHSANGTNSEASIIQLLATQLMLSACIDPAGNIRRGSSAGLQELVGRHPDQIYEGIALVQIVDYQAVSLRNRAMVKVANTAADLHPMYWQAVLAGLFAWRGIGSSDARSRESAASSIARLAASQPASTDMNVLAKVLQHVHQCPHYEVENMHGYSLAAALILEQTGASALSHNMPRVMQASTELPAALIDFSPRMLHSEFPASLARFVTALCGAHLHAVENAASGVLMSSTLTTPFPDLDAVTDKLLARHEDWILQVIPDLVTALLKLKRAANVPLGCIGAQTLTNRVATDSSKSTMHSAGRAIALGALAAAYDNGLVSDKARSAISSLSSLIGAMNVDWRLIGARALQLVVDRALNTGVLDADIAKLVCTSIHRGLNDYTIDERGDVGSLVRLEAITCASKILSTKAFQEHQQILQVLKCDIYRLSLEKLDRVRLQAALCRQQHLDLDFEGIDIASVSSTEYFQAALIPLTITSPILVQQALLEGCTSCAGTSAEPVLQASRQVLASYLATMDLSRLEALMTTYTTIMKTLLVDSANLQPGLELLAFLLDMHLAQRLLSNASSTFKWRNLLSIVQKSHHRSNDIPKILAAIHVYIGVANVPAVKGEVQKKLISMLKTNPYPVVRIAVAEALWMVFGEESLRMRDWAKPLTQNASVVNELQQKYVENDPHV